MKVKYRIDKKYKDIELDIVDFFSKYLGKTLERDDKLQFKLLDFIVYETNRLILGAEIKSYKETQGSASSWYSYHVRNTKRIKPDTVHSGISNLPVLVRGFIATIDGQIREYAEKNNLSSIWLVQEGKEFLKSLEDALKFLKSRNRIHDAEVFDRNDLLFIKVFLLKSSW